jgi:lipopolysaccharide export system permease protein
MLLPSGSPAARRRRDEAGVMIAGTLARYFGMSFLNTVAAVFLGLVAMVALLDCIELMRRTADIPNVSGWLVAKASLFRVPQVTERILPFCMLVGAMSCYLNLSRRLELVVARSAGISAWEFISPALIVALALGVVATTLYNPMAAGLLERSKRLQAEIFGERSTGLQDSASGFWLRQRSPEGQSILNATASRQQGLELGGVIAFTFDAAGHFQERVEAVTAVLQAGHWRLEQVRVFAPGSPPADRAAYLLATNLTPEQVRESFATPESVSFWQLPVYIATTEHAGFVAAGYRLQYHKLLAQPFMLAAMVLLAAAVSLRFFRFGGVQKMVMGGMAAGFLLYVLAKITDDMSKAGLMHPVAAAWLPVLIAGVIGLVALMYQEDG